MMSKKANVFWLFACAAAVVVGVHEFQFNIARGDNDIAPAVAGQQERLGRKVLYWYDPMLPEHHFDKPGKSPFMDMQLVPQYADGEGAGDVSVVRISSAVAQNFGIRVARVAYTQIGATHRAVGRVAVDEHKMFAVQTRSTGFVERLHVRAVGDHVARGQKIAEIYAPDLLAAQLEYLSLFKVDGLRDVETLRQYAQDRLHLLGMVDAEIDLLRQQKRASPRYGIYAPANGVIAEISVHEGGQITPGTNLVTVADLSSVWLMSELPERDGARVNVGDKARVSFDSFPGVPVAGKVDFIYPDLDATTRSVRVRIVLDNSRNKLRPGMFATADLTENSRRVLAVPSESIIATGTRRVVIIKEASGYRPAEVVVGQEGDGKTEVLAGLSEGEDVVVSGQFLIDSEATLKGVLARFARVPDNALSTPDSAQTSVMQQERRRD